MLTYWPINLKLLRREARFPRFRCDRATDEGGDVLWLIGGIEAGNATQSAQTYRVRVRRGFSRAWHFYVKRSSGAGEWKRRKREGREGGKMEREWECGTDLRYVPFMQRGRAGLTTCSVLIPRVYIGRNGWGGVARSGAITLPPHSS